MANYNKVILVGNLTRDPQLSYTPNNTPVCEFGLAINRRWRGQDGEQRESTCYVDCRAYGRSGETFNQYMSKGRPVLVEGRLDFQQWETPEGQKRSKHMVIVENFQFLGGGRGGSSESSDASARAGYASAPPQGARPAGQPAAVSDDYSAPPAPDPDIPF